MESKLYWLCFWDGYKRHVGRFCRGMTPSIRRPNELIATDQIAKRS